MKFVQLRELETARLVLRKLSMDDLYDYYERLWSDGNVSRYMMWEPHQDIGESLESLGKRLDGYDNGTCYCWAVALKEDDRLIGMIELLRFDQAESSCSFAYLFGKEWWNKGYATEATGAVFDFVREEMEIQRIRVDHMAANGASGAVMRKLGMTHVGSVKGKYHKHGLPVDVECYEIDWATGEELTANDYQRLAMKTLNPALDKRDVLINGVMGLCGEAGEAIDIVKKHLHQGHELDREKLIKELGDIAWYLAETAFALDVSLEKVLRGNLDKLKARYPEGFDTEKSVNR